MERQTPSDYIGPATLTAVFITMLLCGAFGIGLNIGRYSVEPLQRMAERCYSVEIEERQNGKAKPDSQKDSG